MWMARMPTSQPSREASMTACISRTLRSCRCSTARIHPQRNRSRTRRWRWSVDRKGWRWHTQDGPPDKSARDRKSLRDCRSWDSREDNFPPAQWPRPSPGPRRKSRRRPRSPGSALRKDSSRVAFLFVFIHAGPLFGLNLFAFLDRAAFRFRRLEILAARNVFALHMFRVGFGFAVEVVFHVDLLIVRIDDEHREFVRHARVPFPLRFVR